MIYLQITSGRGPAECNLAVKHITERILAEGPNGKMICPMPDSTIISLDGPGATDCAQRWLGTILWVCPLREGKSRKNWYVAVREITLPDKSSPELREENLKWETMRASGKGGQHVNKTNSAVRLTYIPLGISVKAEDERSQHQNRAIALERLKEKLKAEHEKMLAVALATIWEFHNQVERGNPLRTFEGQEFKER